VVGLNDTLFVAAGAATFLAALAVHWILYRRLLAPGLGDADPDTRRRALKRWAVGLLALHLCVLALAAFYLYAMLSRHQSGIAWTAPALGALVGAAAPLQFFINRLLRAATRG
jgi:hypothetical protein